MNEPAHRHTHGAVSDGGYVSLGRLPDFELWERMAAERRPLSFDLELTARCNNDCRHCYINLPAGDRAARAAELTAAEILDIAGEAAELGALWCLLTGGEPLLRDDFAEVYLGLKRLGLLVSVFTNACLVTPAHVELFRRYPPRDIEVSVYGATRETYEAVTRRPGSYDAFVRGLELLLEGGAQGAPEGDGAAQQRRTSSRRSGASAASAPRTTTASTRCCTCASTATRRATRRSAPSGSRPRRSWPWSAPTRSASARCRTGCADGRAGRRAPKLAHTGCDHLFHCGAGNGSFTVAPTAPSACAARCGTRDTVYDLRAGSLREAWEEWVPRVRDLRGATPSSSRSAASATSSTSASGARRTPVSRSASSTQLSKRSARRRTLAPGPAGPVDAAVGARCAGSVARLSNHEDERTVVW